MSDKKHSVKIAKQEGAVDYVEWESSMREYPRSDDFMF